MRADEVKGVVDHIEEGVEDSDLLQLKADHHMLGRIFLQHAVLITIMFKTLALC